MRAVVAEKAGIRAGDRVRIFVKLKPGMERSRVSVYTTYGGEEFSPYVSPEIAAIREKGKPHFAQPYYKLLHEKTPKYTFELIPEVDMTVRLMHEIDTLQDVAPKVRIKVDGKIAQTFQRFCRNAFGRDSRLAQAYHWPARIWRKLF